MSLIHCRLGPVSVGSGRVGLGSWHMFISVAAKNFVNLVDCHDSHCWYTVAYMYTGQSGLDTEIPAVYYSFVCLNEGNA